ncbi:hypothetical protein D0T49_12830 [Paludibacter sp. 221]|uniref:hypothetical protein n=1 Tax=Paludibacter sp. 221 TaxID=2302939 RepID=UPI0013CF78AA|nr:hypothetical protein [Paludibacter sp. 221]NDV47929.1 hypothetical protein [Paludibacter sp. 221]
MFCLFQFSFFIFSATAQVTIGADSQPNENAVLDLRSNYAPNKHGGLLLPRVELTALDDASPLAAHIEGMTVYNTKEDAANSLLKGIYYNDGEGWVRQQEAIQQESRTFVYVDKNSPNTAGAAFDDVSPLDEEGNANSNFQNDNTLKANANYLYIGLDNSMWIYNSTSSTYITYTSPAATAWYVAGTSTDAGASKTAHIKRSGAVTIDNRLIVTGGKTHANGAINMYYNPDEITKTGGYKQIGIASYTRQRIASGVENTEYLIGARSHTFLGDGSKGTLNVLKSVDVLYGIWETNVTGKVKTAYGIYVQGAKNSGTIDLSYDLYITSSKTGTTSWGVYVAGAEKRSLFSGRTLFYSGVQLGGGGGTAETDLTGTLRRDGANLIFHNGTEWRVVTTTKYSNQNP